MKPYNRETQSVIEYLESFNSETINELLDEFFSSDDMEEKMDICESVLSELEFTFDEEELDSDWFMNLHDDLKDLVFE
jgi:hypothetical protein